MNQETETLVRRTVKFDQNCLNFVHALAKDKNWPFDYTAYVLLQYAVKEKQRKSKKSHSNT